MNGGAGSNLGVAYIEPLTPSVPRNDDNNSRIVPPPNPPRRAAPEIPINTLQPTYYQRKQSNGMSDVSSKGEVYPPTRISSKLPSIRGEEPNTESVEDTKRYLKALVDEMQSLKLEMSKMRQSSTEVTNPRARSDSIQVDLKQLRSDIDVIRSRIAMTPRNYN